MSAVKRVYLPSRILERNVGGNTTYARELAKGLRSQGIKIETLRSTNHAVLTALWETWQGYTLPRSGEEIIHYCADTGPLLPTHTPSVVTVHGVASRWIRTARSASQEQVWRTRVRQAIRSTQAVITVSQSSASDIAEVFDLDQANITVILHGIDSASFARRVPLTGRLQYLESAPYVLYLGNIEPRKNLIELVRAFGRQPLLGLGAQLVIAGKPAWNSDESMAAITGSKVEYLGFVNDEEKIALMQHALLFAFPSLYEGFGFPVLEALAAGTPVICSDRGSLKEVAGPSLLFDSIDAEGICLGIASALSDETARRQVQRQGPAWARGFSWEQSVKEHIRVYEQVLKS